MKNRLSQGLQSGTVVFLLLALAVTAIRLALPRSAALAASGTPVPKARGAGYLESEETLYALARQHDSASTAALRLHAWKLLYDQLTINRDAGDPGQPDTDQGPIPPWEKSWSGKCDLGLSTAHCPAPVRGKSGPRRFEQPTQLTVLAAGTPASGRVLTSQVLTSRVPTSQVLTSQVHLSSSLFNAEARNFLVQNRLADPSAWFADSPPLTHPLDPHALIVKEVWEILPACTVPHQDCNTPMAIADRSFPQPLAPGTTTFGAISDWPHPATVNLNPDVPCERSRDYTAPAVIPLQCFHFIAWPKNQLPTNILTDQGRNYSPQFPTYSILVGFSILSGEVHNWVWSTFWWDSAPGRDGQASDKPVGLAALGGPWRFFAMNTFVSPDNPGPGIAGSPSDPIVYNPYLEGPEAGGVVSNCLYCHSHAVYRSGSTAWVKNDLIQMAIPPSKAPAASYFDNAAQTHFLWGIAMRLDPAQAGIVPVVAAAKPKS